jgi:hypothetical protein
MSSNKGNFQEEHASRAGLQSKIKDKSIPVSGHEGPYGCERLRLPHFLDNLLTDGGKVVSPKRRPPFNPRKIPGTHFC